MAKVVMVEKRRNKNRIPWIEKLTRIEDLRKIKFRGKRRLTGFMRTGYNR